MRIRYGVVIVGVSMTVLVIIFQGILPAQRAQTTVTSRRMGGLGRTADSTSPATIVAPPTAALQDKITAPATDDIAETPVFDAGQALAHIRYLSNAIGPRPAGGKNERLASCYIKDELDKLGFETSIQTFTLPNGQHSYNVIGFARGSSGKSIVLGAHFDSKGGPGANDNASGVGVLLETARLIAGGDEPPHSLHLIFFGAEERIGSKRSDHHFGSRYYVQNMSAEQKASTLAMINIDMVGIGTELAVRALRAEPGPLANDFLGLAASLGFKNTYIQGKDDSDYEAFENAGIPSVWLQWRKDTRWHSPRDTADRIEPGKIDATGKLLVAYLYSKK